MPTLSIEDWHKEVQKIRARGHVLCPLMLKPAGEHKPDVCRCDIEKVRSAYLETHGTCVEESDCLPRLAFPREASDETVSYYRRHSY